MAGLFSELVGPPGIGKSEMSQSPLMAGLFSEFEEGKNGKEENRVAIPFNGGAIFREHPVPAQ